MQQINIIHWHRWTEVLAPFFKRWSVFHLQGDSSSGSAEGRRGSVVSDLGSAFLRFFWLPWVMICMSHWADLRCASLRSWFSARKGWHAHSRLGMILEEFRCLVILFMSEGRREQKTDRQTDAASAVTLQLYQMSYVPTRGAGKNRFELESRF